jgi:hypothetical protein
LSLDLVKVIEKLDLASFRPFPGSSFRCCDLGFWVCSVVGADFQDWFRSGIAALPATKNLSQSVMILFRLLLLLQFQY